MIEVLLALNALLSGGVLVYVVRVEHRFTRLETLMDLVMQRYPSLLAAAAR